MGGRAPRRPHRAADEFRGRPRLLQGRARDRLGTAAPCVVEGAHQRWAPFIVWMVEVHPVPAAGFPARMNHKPRMPFRVLGLDLIDVAGVCCLLVQSSPERPFLKGAEMPGLMDRSSLTQTTSPPDGIELRPLSEPDPLRANPSYVSSAGATVITCEELAEAGSAATPPAPKLDHFGDRVSHMT